MCYGNNFFKSEAFLPDFLGEISGNVYLYRAPDLYLFNPFEQRTTPELLNLVGDQECIGKGVSVFVVLISQGEIFSHSLLEILYQ